MQARVSGDCSRVRGFQAQNAIHLLWRAAWSYDWSLKRWLEVYVQALSTILLHASRYLVRSAPDRVCKMENAAAQNSYLLA